MKIPAIALSLLVIAGNAHADLPMLKDDPWLGSFIAFKGRDARFLLSSKGNAKFEPLKRDGSPIAATNPITVKFLVIETLPGGKTVSKKIDGDAFTSESPATLDPKEPVTIRGTVTGGAKFEVTVSGGKGEVSFSGRITDKGSITNPLHLSVSFDFKPYRSGAIMDKEQQKNFDKKTRKDEIKLELSGGGRETLEFLDAMDPVEKVPDGFSAAEIRSEGYNGLRWNLTATPNSTLRFENTRVQPLWNGFTIIWTPSEGADPGAEKFTIKYT